MHLRLPIILLVAASAAALAHEAADETATHTIAVDGSHRPPGYPKATPQLLAFGGKPLRVVWKDTAASAEIPVSVDRITKARRIPVANAIATASEGEWRVEWTPPLTRGVVTYEIQLKKESMTHVLLEVRNPDEFQDQLKALKSMDWEAAGLERSEADALAGMGLRLRTAGNGNTPLLRMISSDPAQSRRIVSWDLIQPDFVVWRYNPAAGGIEIRAPRWWISAAALATDEGRIRLVDLFSSSPLSH